MCAVTLRRAHFEIPMQLLFCIASHMAGTINTGSNCSSQPAKVQNRENDGDRGWAGRGGERSNICLKKTQEQGKNKEKKVLKGRRIHYSSKNHLPWPRAPDSAFSKSIFYNNKSERAPGVWEMRANFCLKRQGRSF